MCYQNTYISIFRFEFVFLFSNLIRDISTSCGAIYLHITYALLKSNKMETSVFGPYNADNIHPGFSIDCVILSFYKGKIKILLNKFSLKNYWSLPGGFMLNEEDADQAAHRILESRTGLTDIFLKQFYLFSDPKRTIMKQNIDFVNKNASSDEEGTWLLRRFISLGYYALVKYESVKLPSVDKEKCKWYDIDELPAMYSDHENIIKTAFEMIRAMFPILPIGYELLPEKFTMTELRKIYETILGKEFDRRNFQRKILSQGTVIQLEEKMEGRTYNAPIMYSFNQENRGIMDNLL